MLLLSFFVVIKRLRPADDSSVRTLSSEDVGKGSNEVQAEGEQDNNPENTEPAGEHSLGKHLRGGGNGGSSKKQRNA
ncbi:hypothetical protein C8J56DRAFT_1051576 [Mycena floridula]|nr:hypothetical protein C8J56DRAFT_1051576 [Mycena floridula]